MIHRESGLRTVFRLLHELARVGGDPDDAELEPIERLGGVGADAGHGREDVLPVAEDDHARVELLRELDREPGHVLVERDAVDREVHAPLGEDRRGDAALGRLGRRVLVVDPVDRLARVVEEVDEKDAGLPAPSSRCRSSAGSCAGK